MIPAAIRMARGLWFRLRGINPQSTLKKSNLPRAWVFTAFIILAGVVVRFNTIVHPFTLADNRHYMFYVFRILLRNAVTKYGAVLVYMVSAWLSINTLGTAEPLQDEINASKDKSQPLVEDITSCRASFLLVWIASTALSVITAPLVEPRYFIIPWLMWRLHVPWYNYKSPNLEEKQKKKSLVNLVKGHDHRLWLETLWFLAVNAVTGYMFLYRGYSWPQEPGKVQRFMW